MTTTHRRLRPAAAVAEDGAAAVLVLLLTPALFGLAGLVLDGGTELAARQHAADLAEQAARGGADALDTNALRTTGTEGLDTAAAQAAACRYVTTDPGATCTATVTSSAAGQQVTVRVRGSHPTVLLGLIGINTLHTDAVGTAQAVTGIRTRLGHG